MKKTALALSILAAALIATAVSAQPGMGGKGRFAWTQDYTPAWTLMTAEERTEWQNKMVSAKTYDECKALQAEHRTTMEARAKEKGVKLADQRQNGCDVMKARGLIK